MSYVMKVTSPQHSNSNFNRVIRNRKAFAETNNHSKGIKAKSQSRCESAKNASDLDHIIGESVQNNHKIQPEAAA